MSYPYLVKIIWDILDEFFKDWQAEPKRWSYEREIQAELYRRFNNVYNTIGKNILIDGKKME